MKYSFRALKSSNKECTNNKNVRARKLLAKLWAPTVTLKDRQRLTVTAIYWSKRFKKYNTKYKNCRGKSAEHWHKGSFLTISPASSSTYSEEVSWFGEKKKKKAEKCNIILANSKHHSHTFRCFRFKSTFGQTCTRISHHCMY